MGYHVTILRTENGKRIYISKEEIFDAVTNRNGLEFTNDQVLIGNNIFLSFHEGTLWLANPNKEKLIEMVALAKILNARVRGDEYETYNDDGSTYIHPDDKKTVYQINRVLADTTRKRKFKTLILNASIFGLFFLIVGTLKYFGFLT